MIKAQIQGIPCLVEMTAGQYVTPSYNQNADSDVDYYGGWIDIEFAVYDRRGYKAPWLEKKMTEDDVEYITQLLVDEG